MNTIRKIRLLRIALSIVLLLLVGLGLSSLFAFTKLKQTKVQNLKYKLYTFERTLEDVRICLDAEVYDLAQLRIEEALQLWNEGQALAQRNPAIQNSFEKARKKHCEIWNDPKLSYSYQAHVFPKLQKAFEKICKE